MGGALSWIGLPLSAALPLALLPMAIGYWWTLELREDPDRRPSFRPQMWSGLVLSCLMLHFGVFGSLLWIALASLWWIGLTIICSMTFAAAMATSEDLERV